MDAIYICIKHCFQWSHLLVQACSPTENFYFFTRNKLRSAMEGADDKNSTNISSLPFYISSSSNFSDGNFTYQESYTGNSEELFYYYLWVFVAPTVYGVIILLGTLGNSLVIYVILSRNAMRTATNILLLNLAIADISFLLICVPFTAHKYVSFQWVFGEVMCKIVQYFLYVTAYVTVYSLVAISFLRYLTIVCSNATNHLRTKRNVTLLCVAIWVVMLAVNVPVLLIHMVKTYADFSFCGIRNVSIGPLFLTFFIFSYALPLILICLLYILIICHLQRSNPSTLDNSHSRERTAHVCKVIFTVVLVFGISWLPLHINSLLSQYGKVPQSAYYEVFRILWYAMAYGNSCANPFIYNYVSQDFRRSFREIICCGQNGNNRRARSSDGASTTEMTRLATSNHV